MAERVGDRALDLTRADVRPGLANHLAIARRVVAVVEVLWILKVPCIFP